MPKISSPASSLQSVASGLRNLKGWKRMAAAFGFGCLGALAFPPLNLTPVLWISFPALILCLQGTKNARQAFAVGWSFAFGLFLLGLYWIADSMFVDITQFWWAVPLAVAGLPAFFAIYYGLAAIAARKFGVKGFAGALGFALIWFLADEARGHLFTGFPWNLEGYAWAGVLPMLQITSVIGIYGLTLITLIAACLPVLLIDGTRRGRVIVMISLAMLVLLDFWGSARLASAPAEMVPDVRLRIVQPDIAQTTKWKPETRESNFEKILDLSSAPALKKVTHIIWPETAATFYLIEDEQHRHLAGLAAMAMHVPQDGAILTGIISSVADEGGKTRFYNSLIAVNDKAQVMAAYNKHHLVPYGEYIPGREFIPIPALASLGLDFSAGDGIKTLRVKGLPPFSPLICYEAIFPGDVADRADRPGFLLNVTNDGWYGRTSGPYQHFAIARVRAIEEGLPLVRAANTGISGVVDAYGRVTAKLGLMKSGFLDADLPVAIPPTIFSKLGEILIWALYGTFMLCAVIFRRIVARTT